MVRSTPIAPPATPLTDGSVVLRPRREDDLDAIAAASRDPETLRWLDDPPMDAEARRTGMSRVEEAWRSGRAAPLTIADAATDQASVSSICNSAPRMWQPWPTASSLPAAVKESRRGPCFLLLTGHFVILG